MTSLFAERRIGAVSYTHLDVYKRQVIPKAARDTFHLSEGDRLVVLGDEEQGIALIKAEVFEERMQEALRAGQKSNE